MNPGAGCYGQFACIGVFLSAQHRQSALNSVGRDLYGPAVPDSGRGLEKNHGRSVTARVSRASAR
jgi:hypothetical protein